MFLFEIYIYLPAAAAASIALLPACIWDVLAGCLILHEKSAFIFLTLQYGTCIEILAKRLVRPSSHMKFND